MMPNSPLPIFQILDFEPATPDPTNFYYAGLKNHLATHQFIQKPHKHDFYIIVLFSQGKGSHTIDFQSYPVSGGAVFFLRPGQVHSWSLSEDSDGHILFFSAAFYASLFSRSRLKGYSLFNSSQAFPHLETGSLEKDEIFNVFGKILVETSNPQWATNDLLRNYIDVLLIYFQRFKAKKNPYSKDEKIVYDQFQQVEMLLESNFKQHREAGFYAEKLNLSLKQLNALCKRTVSKTITQLVLDRVILEAQRLLIHADLNISKIAYELEFEDASYFSRLFKKKTGATPEQFREQLEKNSV
ncbi:AraC family transcriptional regulator [Algoriphagus aquimarinus]|uniref:AraC-type DNA-binding protein n=1 Tax=Algoriphagus aquimarinus TaxID=237018 RepID=A0A1I0WTM3_9BACT|nr:AraC family transcriptional regulator [Algoriphagus aquimarinus]SFA91356.1 AraC-type DNA-binding protein [Algoriphagus aquimarinus]|tara:strand:+ start:53229 stop:54122 length:894 start_codon:yes stop_codon:yes gene_type:complete